MQERKERQCRFIRAGEQIWCSDFSEISKIFISSFYKILRIKFSKAKWRSSDSYSNSLHKRKGHTANTNEGKKSALAKKFKLAGVKRYLNMYNQNKIASRRKFFTFLKCCRTLTLSSERQRFRMSRYIIKIFPFFILLILVKTLIPFFLKLHF